MYTGKTGCFKYVIFLFFGMLYLKSSTGTIYNHGINKKKMNVQYIYHNIDYVH